MTSLSREVRPSQAWNVLPERDVDNKFLIYDSASGPIDFSGPHSRFGLARLYVNSPYVTRYLDNVTISLLQHFKFQNCAVVVLFPKVHPFTAF
jgi:hypothetical protein